MDMKQPTYYTKLFSSLVLSTIWREEDEIRLVWITMLALKGPDHIVEGSVPGLADMARVPVEKCREALARLLAPDPDSRTPDHEGRRIEVVPGVGWRILNGEIYKRRMDKQEMAAYKAAKQAEYRARDRAAVKPIHHPPGTTAEEREFVRREGYGFGDEPPTETRDVPY